MPSLRVVLARVSSRSFLRDTPVASSAWSAALLALVVGGCSGAVGGELEVGAARGESAPTETPRGGAGEGAGEGADVGEVTAAATRASGAIKVVVSVDWEGDSLDPTNLSRMAALRRRFPTVPLVHFLNAAYYTKPGADAAAVTRTVGSVLRAGDELGLHIHAWRSLVEASGVTYRGRPSLFDEAEQDCSYDCGFDVPLSAYTESELRRVIAFSVRTLEAQGFGVATSFRAGAWIGAPVVHRALAAEGFRFDHSAANVPLLAAEIRGTLLERLLTSLWSSVGPTSQPYVVTTSRGALTEVPDNGALADYVTSGEMLRVFDANVDAFRRDPTKDVVVSLGFHQETAEDWHTRIEGALAGIQRRAASSGLPVRLVTSAEVVAR